VWITVLSVTVSLLGNASLMLGDEGVGMLMELLVSSSVENDGIAAGNLGDLDVNDVNDVNETKGRETEEAKNTTENKETIAAFAQRSLHRLWRTVSGGGGESGLAEAAESSLFRSVRALPRLLRSGVIKKPIFYFPLFFEFIFSPCYFAFIVALIVVSFSQSPPSPPTDWRRVLLGNSECHRLRDGTRIDGIRVRK
jgi:hypothetical protein